MPLIIVTGFPSSGKSKVTQELSEYIKSRLSSEQSNCQVTIVTDSEQLENDDRNEVYMNAGMEKELRGLLKSEVQRYINLGHLVILDAAAYIKGYRYELHCITKEAKTQYCVIELTIDKQVCWERNSLRDQDMAYNQETFDALFMRYETCDDKNRWDLPLFSITAETEPLPFEPVYETIFMGKPLKPNKCTKSLV